MQGIVDDGVAIFVRVEDELVLAMNIFFSLGRLSGGGDAIIRDPPGQGNATFPALRICSQESSRRGGQKGQVVGLDAVFSLTDFGEAVGQGVHPVIDRLLPDGADIGDAKLTPGRIASRNPLG